MRRSRASTAVLWAAISTLPISFVACGGAEAGGAGGTGRCDLDYGPKLCAAALCGDNVRDACFHTPDTGYTTCASLTIREPCDGVDLGTLTCQSFGFSSGTLRCSPKCDGFDTRDCSSCMLGTSIVGCGPVVPTAPVFPLAADIAATDAEIAMAWVDVDDADVPRSLSFARLTPELSLIGLTQLDEPGLVANDAPGFRVPVTVAPAPSRWIVAGWTMAGHFVHTIDSDGRHLGRLTFDGPSLLPTAGATTGTFPPMLAARPDAGPLLAFVNSRGWFGATVISADGASMTEPIEIVPGEDGGYQLMGATFAGDTFYVLFAPTGGRGIRVARVSTDGALLGIDSLLDDVPVRDPFFVDGASEPRIVYSTWVMTPVEFDPQGGGVGWIFVEQSLDPAGGPPGAPHTLTTDGGDFQWIKGVAFGTDTVVALEGAHQPPRLAAARLAADGTLATAPFDITDGTQPEWHRIVRRGTEAVVAWFGTPASLHVARLRP